MNEMKNEMKRRISTNLEAIIEKYLLPTDNLFYRLRQYKYFFMIEDKDYIVRRVWYEDDFNECPKIIKNELIDILLMMQEFAKRFF